jgi:hypothetical protein
MMKPITLKGTGYIAAVAASSRATAHLPQIRL